MAIQWYEKSTLAHDLVFDRVPFWVQVYDIPFRFANKVVTEGICSGIGEACPSDFSVMEGDDFTKVRVDNAWMISGLKLSSTLPRVVNKS